MRMAAQTAMIENCFVHLPKDTAWLPTKGQELTTFPRTKYGDQVDSGASAKLGSSSTAKSPESSATTSKRWIDWEFPS